MPHATTITLEKPLALAGGQVITTITLRAPTLSDLAELGEPLKLRGSEIYYIAQHWDIISAYIERCISAPENPAAWINDLGLEDTLTIKDAMIRLWHSTKSAAKQFPSLPINHQTKG